MLLPIGERTSRHPTQAARYTNPPTLKARESLGNAIRKAITTATVARNESSG